MRIKVELDREVLWFVRRQCSKAEQDAFYAALDRVFADPVAMIRGSEGHYDPELSRYMERFFRFGDCIAIFETNRGRDRARVRKCQRVQRPKTEPGRPNGRP